jgi:hypothetical protein
MHHTFNKDSYDKYDELARSLAKQLFKRYEVELMDNSDKYGVDLLAYRNDVLVGYVEVEIKRTWQGLFKYTHLNVPVRKEKLLRMPLRAVLVTFSNDSKSCFICNDNIVLNSKIEEVKNKEVASNEMFYKVPINLIKLVTL